MEKILFQGKSDFQNVMVFQVHVPSVKFENFLCCHPFHGLGYVLMYSVILFCSHQHMARFLFWMESFSSQKEMSVPTKR